MFVEIESARPIVFNGVAKSVKEPYPRVTTPREDQLSSASCADQLIANQIGRESYKSEISASLSNDLVTRREWDEVRETLERDDVAIVDMGCDSGLKRCELCHYLSRLRPSIGYPNDCSLCEQSFRVGSPRGARTGR